MLAPNSSNSVDKLFLSLREYQIHLIKNPSKKTINDYKNQLRSLVENESQFSDENNENLNSLLHFLTFPVLVSLKKLQDTESKKLRDWCDLNEELIKCLHLVLDKIKLNDLNNFYEMLNICSIIISQKDVAVSDEFYLACFRLIELLLQSGSNVLNSFYQFKNLTSIGLLVSVFLDILNASSSLEVRISALNSIQLLNRFDSVKIGYIMSSFLPGISIKIIQRFLLTQNLKLLNHKLICQSLDVLSLVIENVFDDVLLDKDCAKNCYVSLIGDTLLSENIKGLIVNRNENNEWLSISSEKLFALIRPLLDELVINENLNVHHSLVKFCANISKKCYFTLNSHLSVLLRVLAMFAANSVEKNLSQFATEALDAMGRKETESSKQSGEYMIQNKFSIVQSCMEELLLKLPRILESENDSNNNLNENYRLSHLKTLYGYLKLIGTENYKEKDKQEDLVQLKEFFYLNLENLNKLLFVLISCVSFDYKSLDNFYEVTNEVSSVSMSNYSGLKTYLSDKYLFDQLSLICNYLGRSDAARLFIDELLTNNLIHLQYKQTKCEIMFLINLILNGAGQIKADHEELHSMISLVLASFISEFKAESEDKVETIESLVVTNEKSSSFTQEKNRKILQTCLVIEAISTSSKCLPKKDYDLFLIDTLYFCLENYLNNNLLIRVVATKCLEKMAANLDYSSIQDLLSQNYDYIMNDLILKSYTQTRRIVRVKPNAGPSGPEEAETTEQLSHVYVLCSLLDISNVDIVPYLERLIDDYFMSIELSSQDNLILIGICNIMLHMSRSMRRWYPIKLNFLDETTSSGQDFLSNLNLKSLVKAKQKPECHQSFVVTLNEIEESIHDFRSKEEALLNDTQKSVDEILKENEQELESMQLKELEKEEEKKEPELHVKLQSKCMQLCIHLISHPYKQIRLSIIDLMAELSRNLAEHTNEFLPLVHKLWMPICQRFALDDLIIKSKIVYFLFDLSVYCSDFLASRFRKEFMPRLCKFMQEQSVISFRSTRGTGDPTYVYSHAFKLQSAILSSLDKICILFDIKEMELENVITTSVSVYLDKRQPKKLQLLALKSIQNYALIDPDLIWLCLHYIMPFASINANFTDNQSKLIYSKTIKQKSDYQLSNDILDGLVLLFRELMQFN
jgi:hypothetical protein